MTNLKAFRSGSQPLRTLCYWLVFLLAQPWILVGSARAAYVDETAGRLPAAEQDSYNFAVADVDGANGSDLLIANRGQSRLLINDGSGTFTDETASRLPVLLHTTLAVALVDVDGANGPDAFLAGDGQNRLLMNDGSGNFTDETATRLPTAMRVSIDVVAGDIDADGDMDLVIANRRSANRILINDGSGHFTDQSATRLASDMDLSYGVALGDADGNGSLDIFFANFAGQNRLHLNNNLGKFTDVTGARLPVATGTTGGAAFFDADGDGDMDIATAEGGNGVGLLLNDGSGSYSDAAMPAIPEFGIRVRPGDINFDGSQDLLVATMGQDRVLLNNGAGAFTDATASEMPVDDRRSFGALLFDADSDLDLDAVLATPAGQNRFLDNAIAGPRILIAISPDYIERTDTVTIDLTAFDENGVTTLDAFVVAPSAPGTEIPLTLIGDTNSASASYEPTEIGEYIVRVRASDGVNNSEKEARFDALANDVTNPTVSLAFDPTTVTQGEAVDFTVSASDDRAVTGLSLSVGGVNVPLDNQGEASFTPLTIGSLAVEAVATDAAGNTGSDSGTLTVLADTESPVVTLDVAPPSLDVTNPWSITTSATDNIGVTSSSLVVNGPAGVDPDTPVTVAPDGTASYTPFIPGDYTFTLRAADAAGNESTAASTVTATGVQDIEAPVVSISVVPGTTIPGGLVTVTVNATDNIFVLDRTLTINGIPQTLDGSFSVQYTAQVLGSYTAVATASDPSGNTATETVTFEAVDPATDTDPPAVSIDSPDEGAEVSGVVPIIGTATDLTLVSYNLAYKRTQDPASAYVEFATGSQVVENGPLGSFDTSILENGLYDIRLQAFDVNGLGSQVSTTISAVGEFKPGIFTISYEDMRIPLSGIELSVNREYDSRRRNINDDFGYGWNLRVVQDGTYVNNRELGEGWTGLTGGGFLGLPCGGGVREDLYHVTEIRFSDTEFYKFALEPTLTGAFLGGGYCEIAGFGFNQVGGVPGATLVPVNAPEPLGMGGGYIIDFDFNVWNPDKVQLTTLDGRIFLLDLQNGLERMTDRNGNTLNFSTGGVIHSNGKSISIARDGSGRVTSITDPLGNSTSYTYDGDGNLQTSTDRAGNTTNYQYLPGSYLERIIDPEGNIPTRNEYDTSGRLVAQIDAAGNRTEFDRDLDTGTEQVTDRGGNVTITQYDEQGNLDSATIGSSTSTYTHDDRGNKLTDTNPNGHTTTFTYDDKDRMLTQTDPLGNVTNYDYDAQNITRLTDPLGNALAFSYDGNRNLTEQRDADGNLVQGFAYEANGDLNAITTEAGTTGIETNGDGNPTRLTDPNGNERSFTYDGAGRRTSTSVSRTVGGSTVSETTTFAYDGNGRVLTKTGPLAGATATFAYDGNGRTTRETDPLGRQTDFTYDSRGNLTRIDYPDGNFRAFGYDLTDRLTAETDPEGNTTFYEYDNNDRLTRTIYPDGGSLTRTYNAGGNLLTVTDGLGNTRTYTYDALNRVLTRTDPEGGVTSYTYTGNQINPTTMTDPRGNVTSYEYDDSMLLLEYPVKTTLPGGVIKQQAWGPNSRVTSRTDANGNTTSFEYDAVGNLTKVIDAAGNATTYTYDEVGNRLTQTDALLRTTSFTYDALGNLLSRTLPGGQVETFSYDLVGNLLTHTDFNGDTTTYTYDAMDRRITATLPDTSVETYSYSATGMPTSITDATGTSTFTYDPMDRLATATTPDGVTLTYSYDKVGNRTALEGAGDRDFGYDGNRRLASVTVPGTPDPLVTSYSYDAAGNLTGIEYPNNTEARFTYNVRNQTVRVTHLAPDDTTVLADYQYDLDAVGNRIKLIESGGLEIDYSYDSLHRLTSATETSGGSGRTWAYSYDEVGNILEFSIPGTTDTATYDANDRLLTVAGRSFSYDANGNILAIDADGDALSTDDITTFSYDSRNRLIERVESDGTTSQFEYDARGNRISRTVAGVTTGFVVDSNDPSGVSRVLQERDGGGSPSATIIQGHRPLGIEQGGSVSWIHTDALGSVRALSSPVAVITDTYSYDPFGNLDSSTGSTVNEYGFAGERQDPSTGLYYLRARYLDPEIARFISRDPHPGLTDMPASLHPYQYAWNNPVNNIDPSGEFGMISISISISIAVTLSTVYFTIFKPAKEAYDELQTLLSDIPSAKLNEESSRDELGVTVASVVSAYEEEDIEKVVNLGGGAVEKAYGVVYKMSTTMGKVVALIHARNSAEWMKYLSKVDDKPAHYLDCGFNGYVQKTYSLGLVVGAASGKKIALAANIIAAYLSYFNFLVLVMETVDDFVGNGDDLPESCPAIPS